MTSAAAVAAVAAVVSLQSTTSATTTFLFEAAIAMAPVAERAIRGARSD
jgi:hypothetical protein